MEEFRLIVDAKDKSCRLDRYIVEKLNKRFSRSFIQELIHNSNIRLDEKETKPHHVIKAGESIHIVIPPAKIIDIKPESIPLDIIFEDEDVLVVNKPSGLVVHPAIGNYSGTLVNALLHHTENLSSIDPKRPGIVHRLDKDTSGVLVVAKNNQAHINLRKQFQNHRALRKYIALVKGKVEFDEGSIDLPLTKDKRDFRKIKVGFIKSKKALTRYRVIKRSDKYSALEIRPQTGRTHQIRVHLAFIDHPILGDAKYGKREGFSRLALHAVALGFYHPSTRELMNFSSPIPDEFKKLM